MYVYFIFKILISYLQFISLFSTHFASVVHVS